MVQNQGKVFAYGHLLVASIVLFLYATGESGTSLLILSICSFIGALLLIGSSHSGSKTFTFSGTYTYIVYTVADFVWMTLLFTIPAWSPGSAPTWLVLLFVLLYSFELGLKKSVPIGLLSLVAIFIMSTSQASEPFYSLETLLITGGIVLIILFIGPTTDRVNQIAYYDSLTGLPNRKMFHEHLQLELSELNGKDQMVAVMFLDLDGFKYINDTMGHLSGDKLLQGIKDRLREALPKSLLLSRMGGDEFAVCLTRIKATDEAAEIAELILKQFNASFSLNMHEVFVTCSIGIAVAPLNGTDSDTLMRNADAALYHAKDQGRNNYQFYDQPSKSSGMERIQLETMLRHALDRNEFIVYYQPRIETSTGRLVCVEALIRWQHPERGMIPPMEFIPLAEETGLIVQIGEKILRTVCAQRKVWNELGLIPFRVSVNLSARQFRQTELPELIQQVLKSTGLQANMLELEITESAAMTDVNYAILMLRVLKEMGLTIAIDDFGTGYSSLSYLKRFPLDVLKIDKSFTSGIHTDNDDDAIVRAIIAMGHSLKLSITAEGVETAEQLEFLEELGCNEIQGYYIGKPMTPETLVQWINLNYNKDDYTTTA